MNCVTDTHALIWYLFALPHLSTNAKEHFEKVAMSGGHIFVAAICFVEVIYLAEKGRLGAHILPRINVAIQSEGSVLETIELSHLIALDLARVPRGIVPDMPDRIIAATALHLDLPLVTKDRKIRSVPSIQTIW